MRKRKTKTKTKADRPKQEENPKGRVESDTEMLVYMWFLDHMGEERNQKLNLGFEHSL